MNYGIMKKQYLRNVVNRSHTINGLFLWLSVNVTKKHLNILHISGVWTSCRSDITVLTDATVVLVLNCCLATQHMTRDEIKKSVDDEYTMPLRDPRAEAGHFVSMPKILNDPVKSVGEHLDEIGLVKKMDCQPIQNLLA